MCSAGAAMAGDYTSSGSNRSLMPDGTHGYPKEGDVVNTGGASGKDFIFTGSEWVPKV